LNDLRPLSIRRIGASAQHDGDLICFSHLRWDFVCQRPQHLMGRFARLRRVIYVEEAIPTTHHLSYLEFHSFHGTPVTAVRPRVPERLDEEAATLSLSRLYDGMVDILDLRAPALWFYSPMFWPAAAHLAADASAVVYDCMDELAAFDFAPPGLRENEAALMAAADLVLTGGKAIYEAKRARHDNIHAFPSSVDQGHFRRARAGLSEPADQQAIPGPRLGYAGVIDERIDLPLLAAAAAARLDWSFVMIGPVVKIDPARLPQAANIHWLGQRGYDELPEYMVGRGADAVRAERRHPLHQPDQNARVSRRRPSCRLHARARRRPQLWRLSGGSHRGRRRGLRRCLR
jgi:UDP-galactopyranose mutase